MICPKCGNQLQEDAVFCAKCGARVEQASTAEAPNTQMPQQGAQPNGGKNERLERYMRSMFVQEDEYAKAVIGGGYLNNLVHGGTLVSGFGILSNRRMYYRGTCYKKEQKHYKKVSEERVVSLQDITSSGFISVKNFIVFWLAILCSIWTAIMTLAEIADPSTMSEAVQAWMTIFLVAYLPCIALWAFYIFYKTKMYEITFAGGNIAIKASSYSEMEIREFDKALRIARDEYLERNR